MSENTFMQKVSGLTRVTELLLEEKKQYKQAAVKSVDKLVELGAVKGEDREKVANSISEDQEKVFDILTNLAAVNQKQASELQKKASVPAPKKEVEVEVLGGADTIKESAVKVKSSDEIWENQFSV